MDIQAACIVIFRNKNNILVQIAKFGADLSLLENALGQEHIEMYIRQLKMELRAARTIADDQVNRLYNVWAIYCSIYA